MTRPSQSARALLRLDGHTGEQQRSQSGRLDAPRTQRRGLGVHQTGRRIWRHLRSEPTRLLGVWPPRQASGHAGTGTRNQDTRPQLDWQYARSTARKQAAIGRYPSRPSRRVFHGVVHSFNHAVRSAFRQRGALGVSVNGKAVPALQACRMCRAFCLRRTASSSTPWRTVHSAR